MDKDKLQALAWEPLYNFAALLESGEISGEQAGELLRLVLVGIEKRMESAS